MKSGVLRCKNLVEMFLGFSRLDSHYPIENELTIKDIIQQSFDLIRFRLVESNMKYSFDYHLRKEFCISGNPYVLSMTFYLVWSELMTAYSRRNLVDGNKIDQLNLKIDESEREIIIHFSKDVKIDLAFSKSKLFVHLCDLAQIKTQNENGSISILSIK